MTAGQTFLLQAFPASSRKALGVRQLCCPLSCLVSALAIKSVVAFLRGVSGKYIWHKHSAFQRSRVSSGCSVFVWFCFLNTFRKMEVQILSHPKCGTCSMVQWFVTNQLGAEQSRFTKKPLSYLHTKPFSALLLQHKGALNVPTPSF